MRRLFALCVLLTGLAAARTSVTSGGVTYTVRPGVLSAQQGGRELWRQSAFKGSSQVELLVSGKTLLALSSEGAGRNAYLSAYAAGNGRRLWQTALADEDSTALRLRGVSAGTVLLSAVWGPPRIPRVIGVALSNGQLRFKKAGELVGYSGKYAVLLDYGLVLEVPTGAWLPLVRLDMDRAKRTYIGLTIPERPGCGEMRSRTGKSDLKFDLRYVTAYRQDRCGMFTAKVDWYGVSGQKPLVRPVR